MKADNSELVRLVKEMNEADYAINVMLFQAYAHVLDNEITSKQTILLDLVHKHTKLTVSEIAEHMSVTSSAVSQIISKLEKMKYVKREINVHNRREILVLLDERGIEHVKKEEWIEQTIIERFYTQLELDEVETLHHLILKLKQVVERELQPGQQTDRES
ncbi:MarR family winged helix-turn-helix transcriptional regulator [Paenibacillus sp. GCM10027626]|uniref:MarR family winged helix-turn-helix transcriptional regulator n=1 Tax=Paenibacillus sp. GCM10027626 TaxID=3273411 RepID=UPI00362DD38E